MNISMNLLKKKLIQGDINQMEDSSRIVFFKSRDNHSWGGLLLGGGGWGAFPSEKLLEQDFPWGQS